MNSGGVALFTTGHADFTEKNQILKALVWLTFRVIMH